MKIQYANAAVKTNGRIFFLFAVLFASLTIKAQKEFDGIRGTQNWPEFSDAPNALYHHLADRAYADLDKRSQKVAGIHTLAEWQQRQQWLKKTLHEVIGSFPEKKPLNATIVKTYEKDFYRLENIIYESQPGYYVTSTLFIPKGAKKAPAIVYCSGHSDNGYRPKGYLNEILNFVKKGFIVFAFDPMGQGERLQYYNSKTNKSRFKWPSYEHSYPGAQLFITGNTLANYFIWDGIRAVDYLLTRKEVDGGRIGITGRSGGGTQSAYIAAFDDRIKAAAPENYITNMKRLFQAMGPQDAEQNFFYGMDRGLDMGDLLEVRAPKPMLVVTTSQDMFPIQGALETYAEVANVYKAYGKPENFSMVTDDAPHATTLKNREASYVFFQKALNNPGNPKEEQVTLPSDEELQVTKTGQVSTSLNAETAFSINSKNAVKRMQKLKAARKNIPSYLPRIVQSAKQLSGYQEPKESPAPWFAGQIQRKGYVIQKYLLKGEGNYMIPYIILKPELPTQKAMLYLNPSGKAADVQEGGDMEWFVKNGVMVVSPDLVGLGELGPGEFKGDSYVDSVSYNIWFAGILTGRSIVGIRAGDVIRIANQLKKDGVKEIYGLAKKQLSPVLLHAAAFDKDISKIALIQPYSSYRAIVMDRDYNAEFLHSTVAASIGFYDLPDLAASLAPKSLLIAGVTDARGQASNDGDIINDLSVIKAAYQRTAPNKLQIVREGTISQSADELKAWLKN
ncbi:alpha/beta hydrolase family protein [Flavisolibacter ginsenosidimutans]|uniref:Prolyl oligopeptidase family serine peptidase n=1 Tax=Flavisolibacter ginsenosidimutans TaxID=661481 RepID=A0A5B8UJJ6_9BACT|nr:acetylxylan esterase [Flavisolibacter ginsenosidimutans]QEC56319.1 prolyl oligopeptidase family serine peptidase [Flavisolibacter ginsenosidimutans]